MLQSSGIVAILGSGWLTWALTVLGRQGLRGLRSQSWTGQLSSQFVSLISCDMGLSENRGPQNDDCSSFANKHMFPTGLEQYNSPIFRQTHMNHITHNCKNANSATYEVLFLRRSVLYIQVPLSCVDVTGKMLDGFPLFPFPSCRVGKCLTSRKNPWSEMNTVHMSHMFYNCFGRAMHPPISILMAPVTTTNLERFKDL